MNLLNYKIQKVVLSGGYGNRESDQQKKIVHHFSTLLKDFINLKKPQKVLVTTCKIPNAMFKTKEDRPMGLKVTLRKAKAIALLKHLTKIIPDFNSNLIYNNSTLFFGVPDHKILKLQRYNYQAPTYGFNVAIVITPKINRPYKNSRTKAVNSKFVNKDVCLDTLQKSLIV